MHGMSVDAELHWTCAAFAELPTELGYALLRLRCEVFVVEQRCAYLDLDGKDLQTGVWQLLASDRDGRVLASLRGLPPGLAFAEPALGRIATAIERRGSGLGRALLQRGLLEISARHPGHPIRIGAQSYLIRFYQSFGFRVASAAYDEDGIAHVQMLRQPDPDPDTFSG
jgi:ElaA protein